MNKKNKKKTKKQEKKFKIKLIKLTGETKRRIFSVLMFLTAIIITLGFFEKAGPAGYGIVNAFDFLIGKTMFFLPLFFVLVGLILFKDWSKVFEVDKNKALFFPIMLGGFILILGIAGILEIGFQELKTGGILGYAISKPILNLFGLWATIVILISIVIIGILIIIQPLVERKREILCFASKNFDQKELKKIESSSVSDLIKKPFAFLRRDSKNFKVKEVPFSPREEIIKPVEFKQDSLEKKEETKIAIKSSSLIYKPPSFDLLEKQKDRPTSGDIQINSAIIQRTLQNFAIEVEMGEVNIGPTVTQYTLKPAEGVKLSKIVVLANDISLALAAHPIRIEAPIPGRALVGIEVPNKVRAKIRLRDLIVNLDFQSLSSFVFALGKNVAGEPVFVDLKKMPHLLIAGSTGTGKTVCLNSLILNLIYRNSPEFLRFILIDPKRVEFSIYNSLPHLLTPPIINAERAVNVLRWLIKEMERRFDILSEAKVKEIDAYNKLIERKKIESPLPYIVLIIDELADLMFSRGKEVEAMIVRIAQMSRAVGIHLVIATQRPSVEVITGLIKANITSRIAFQVASQVDSRTILDMAGAEKLLGLGDMLYISSETAKPKRIQGVYVSENEIKRIVEYFKSEEFLSVKEKSEKEKLSGVVNNDLFENFEKELDEEEKQDFSSDYDDPLYPEAKKVIIRAKKASSSLLQRHLRIGYARAARLIDILEERGVVGPADGAKPREVYIKEEEDQFN